MCRQNRVEKQLIYWTIIVQGYWYEGCISLQSEIHTYEIKRKRTLTLKYICNSCIEFILVEHLKKLFTMFCNFFVPFYLSVTFLMEGLCTRWLSYVTIKQVWWQHFFLIWKHITRSYLEILRCSFFPIKIGLAIRRLYKIWRFCTTCSVNKSPVTNTFFF